MAPPLRDPAAGDLAIVLSGGGARAAYQVGLLRCLARRLPDLRFPVITGVSAGAINAVYLAAHQGTLRAAVDDLSDLWRELEVDDIFSAGSASMTSSVVRWGSKLLSGGRLALSGARAMVETEPLRRLLYRALDTHNGEITGIARNLERGRLRALALTTLDYSTGQTVTWVQGRSFEAWERPNRLSQPCRIGVEHVMASSALPLFFPAVRIGRHWYGDGGVRLAAPLSPALHLGARRVLAISTRYGRSRAEADVPTVPGYPPPAQILGQLLNAIFLDVLDQDVERLERLNRLLRKLPPEERDGMRPVDLLVLRPSVDLGKLASDYEPKLPRAFRFMTRSLGTREAKSADFLSLLMFQPEYLTRLIEIGEADAEARSEEIAALLRPETDAGMGDDGLAAEEGPALRTGA